MTAAAMARLRIRANRPGPSRTERRVEIGNTSRSKLCAGITVTDDGLVEVSNRLSLEHA